MKKKFVCMASVVAAMATFATLEFSDVASFLCPDGENNMVATLLGTILWSAPPQDREVQWLESTGTQYILFNTWFNGIEVKTRPEVLTIPIYGVCGIWNGGSRADTITYRNRSDIRGFKVFNGSNNGSVNTTLTLATREVSVHGTEVIIDGNVFTMGKAWHATNLGNYFALFGSYRTDTGVVICQSCRIGYCRLYRGVTLMYDLVPYVKDGIGCMYDKLSDTYLYNQGTGEFIIGPDL